MLFNLIGFRNLRFSMITMSSPITGTSTGALNLSDLPLRRSRYTSLKKPICIHMNVLLNSIKWGLSIII